VMINTRQDDNKASKRAIKIAPLTLALFSFLPLAQSAQTVRLTEKSAIIITGKKPVLTLTNKSEAENKLALFLGDKYYNDSDGSGKEIILPAMGKKLSEIEY